MVTKVIKFGNTDEEWLNAISVCGSIQNTYKELNARVNCANIGRNDDKAGVFIEMKATPELFILAEQTFKNLDFVEV